MDQPGRSKQLIALALAALCGCSLETGTYAGKTCTSNVDCPLPYVCAQVRPDQRTCELVRGIDDMGSTGPAATVDYCHDARPILERTCVSNCHGADSTGSMRSDFRLDAYAFDGGVPQGAFAFSARIKARTQDDTMPPTTDMVAPRTTMAEKTTLANWVNGGALECVTDGGTDAGSADGG